MKFNNNPDKEISRTAPKHRVFCPSANRQKLLFETERKALNFIRYNGDAIEKENGYRPIRAYYCACCGGYHTTSQRHNTLTEQQLDAIVERGESDSIELKLSAIARNTERRIEDVLNVSFTTDDDMNNAFSTINGARSGIDGYLKLASHLNSTEHVSNVETLRNKLKKNLADVITTLRDNISSNIESENFYEAGRYNRYTYRMVAMLTYIDSDGVYKEFINETNEYTHSMVSIIKENGGEYREDKGSKVEHYLGKIQKYMDLLDMQMENKLYVEASKSIHFSLKYIKKIVGDADGDVLKPIVDKLYETKQTLLEVAPQSDFCYQKTSN